MAKKRPAAKKTAKKAVTKKAKKKAAGRRKPVVVTVGDRHKGKIGQVAGRLRARGMRVEHVQKKIGTVTGSTTKDVSKLKSVKGVADAEEAPQFQLPPPDSDVQ